MIVGTIIIVILIIGLFTSSAIWYVYCACKLWTYMRVNYQDKWVNITSIGSFGPGMNSIKGLEFLLSNENFEDVIVDKYKRRCRYAMMSLVASFILSFWLGLFWFFFFIFIKHVIEGRY